MAVRLYGESAVRTRFVKLDRFVYDIAVAALIPKMPEAEVLKKIYSDRKSVV